MANVMVSASGFCGGNGHATLAIVAGPIQRSVRLTFADVLAPITNEEIEAWAKVTVRIRRELDNRSNAQLRSDLISGLTVGVTL